MDNNPFPASPNPAPTPEPTPAPTTEPAPITSTPEPTPNPMPSITEKNPTADKKKAKINFKSPLFIGIIAGGVALVAAVIVLVVILMNQNTLSGTWKLSKYERNGEGQDTSKMGLEVKFTSDREGTYKSTYDSTTTEFKFLYNKDRIVAWDEESSYGSGSAMKYEIKDEKIILSPVGDNSDNYKIYLEKK